MVMHQDFFPLSIDIQFVMIHLNQAEQKTRVESEYFLWRKRKISSLQEDLQEEVFEL